ncbi:MAG: hypothetical protein ACKVP5_05630 [Aestuariivirga sp.]
MSVDKIVPIALLSLAGLALSILWIKEIFFYGRRRWDFSIDSGILNMGPGVEGGEPLKVWSNKTRVLLGYPFFLVVIFGICLGMLYSEF